jgi:predicted nucleic acid-binding protein
MSDRIVFNTSPLIALARMDAFDVIAKLPFEFVCPAEVETEILIGASHGHPVIFPSWITVLFLTTPLSPLTITTLDEGEAAVIQLALEQSIEYVCIDEIKGRRAALAVGLKVVGSLGLIGKAKTRGLISEARPFVEQAQSEGIYYDKMLVENFLKSLGE